MKITEYKQWKFISFGKGDEQLEECTQQFYLPESKMHKLFGKLKRLDFPDGTQHITIGDIEDGEIYYSEIHHLFDRETNNPPKDESGKWNFICSMDEFGNYRGYFSLSKRVSPWRIALMHKTGVRTFHIVKYIGMDPCPQGDDKSYTILKDQSGKCRVVENVLTWALSEAFGDIVDSYTPDSTWGNFCIDHNNYRRLPTIIKSLKKTGKECIILRVDDQIVINTKELIDLQLPSIPKYKLLAEVKEI